MAGYDVSTWYGFFGPRGIPPEIVAKLNKALNEALKDEAVREKLTKAGVTVQGSTPEEFGKFMARRACALEQGARGGGDRAAVERSPRLRSVPRESGDASSRGHLEFPLSRGRAACS